MHASLHVCVVYPRHRCSLRTFHCPHSACDYRSERDAHGARNIMAMNVERYVGTVVVPVHTLGPEGGSGGSCSGEPEQQQSPRP